jgi:hypothetical protein
VSAAVTANRRKNFLFIETPFLDRLPGRPW